MKRDESSPGKRSEGGGENRARLDEDGENGANLRIVMVMVMGMVMDGDGDGDSDGDGVTHQHG